jgi:hypothetical protein
VANQALLTFDVPARATNVSFRHSFYDSLIDVAEFEISEDDFLKWMKVEGRSPVGFETGKAGVVWSNGKTSGRQQHHIQVPIVAAEIYGSHELALVERGYYFDDYQPAGADDSGLTIVFDKAQKRVHMWRTTF